MSRAASRDRVDDIDVSGRDTGDAGRPCRIERICREPITGVVRGLGRGRHRSDRGLRRFGDGLGCGRSWRRRGRRSRLGRRGRRPIEQELVRQRRGHPWDFFTVRGSGHSGARVDEGALDTAGRTAELLEQFAHEKACLEGIRDHELAWAGGKERQRSVGAIDRGQSQGARLRLCGVRIGRVQDGDLHPGTGAVQLLQFVVDPDAILANLGLGRERDLDRQQIVLMRDLRAETGEVDQYHRTRLDLAVEATDRLLHRLGSGVFAQVDIETRALQLILQKKGIVGGGA